MWPIRSANRTRVRPDVPRGLIQSIRSREQFGLGLDLAQEPHGLRQDRITTGSKLYGLAYPVHPSRYARKDQVLQVRTHLFLVEKHAIGTFLYEPYQEIFKGGGTEPRVAAFASALLGLIEGEFLDAEAHWNAGASGLREEVALKYRECVVSDVEIGEYPTSGDQLTPRLGHDYTKRVGIFGERVTLSRSGPM